MRISHTRLGESSHLIAFGSHRFLINPPPYPATPLPPLHILGTLSGILITSMDSFMPLIHYLPHVPDEAYIVTTQPLYDLGIFYLTQWDTWNGTQCAERVQQIMRVAGVRLPSSKHSHDKTRSSTAQLKCLAFHEKFHINNHHLCIEPLPSGHTLGSPNFLITHTALDLSIAYITASSSIQNRYTAQFDYEPFASANLVIVDNVNVSTHTSALNSPHTQTPASAQNTSSLPLASPSSHTHMYDLFTKTLGMTLSNGGNVFIPVHSTGLIYDLLDLVRVYLITLNMQSNVNMYFISPMADASLKYANVSAEYLTESKQNKALYTNEQPFEHETLIQSNQLMIFDEADANFANVFHAKRSLPSIIFAGDPTLAHGDAKSIVRILERDPKSLILMVEPGVDVAAAVAPYKKLNPKLNVKHTPIDLRLTPESIVTLLRIIKPENVICSAEVIPFVQQYNLMHSKSTGENPTYNLYSSPVPMEQTKNLNDCTINIVLKRKFMRAQMDHSLTTGLFPRAMGKHRVARIVGSLKRTDGQCIVTRRKRRRTGNDSGESTTGDDDSFLLFGTVNIKQLFHTLYDHGLTNIQAFTGEEHGLPFGHCRLLLPEMQASIEFSAEGTTIECHGSDEIRKKLRGIISENYFRF